MPFSLPCSTTNNPEVKPINQCYPKGGTNGRIHSLYVTGAGVQLPCYTDSDIIYEYQLRDANYPATLYDGTTTHPNAGSANPNNSKAHLLKYVEGELGEPSPQERESNRSWDVPKAYTEWEFSVDIKTYYHPENQAWLDDLGNGLYEECFITLEDAVGFKVSSPIITPILTTEDEELIVIFRIEWTQATAVLPMIKVPEPLWSEKSLT